MNGILCIITSRALDYHLGIPSKVLYLVFLLRLAAPVLRLATNSAAFALLQIERFVCHVCTPMITCRDLFEAS